MAPNTSYKILDYLANDPVNQYNFTYPDDFAPRNENQDFTINIERDFNPDDDSAWFIEFGAYDRIIALQGRDVADADRFIHSSMIADRRMKKLFMGDDWFAYIRGITPRSIKDVNFPLLHNYIAMFLAPDPRLYFSGTEANDYPAGTSGFGYISAASSKFTLDLTGKGTWFVEPTFIVDNESGNTITFTDDTGRQLSFTAPDNDVWVVMPRHSSDVEGFNPDYPVAFKTSRTLAQFNSVFAHDEKLEGSPPLSTKQVSGSVVSVTDSNSPDVGYGNLYPRFLWNTASDITLSGQSADANVKCQYRYVRM